MKITRGLVMVGVALLTFLFPMAALAECGPGEPGCEFDLPQSVEVNPAPESGAGESVELDDPGAFQPVEIGAPMPVPARLTPVPFPNSNASSGGYQASNNKNGGSHAPGSSVILDVPVRYQAPGYVTCGVQALGMAMDGSTGGKGAASSAILSFLRDNGMMYEFGTGVEELAYAAQSFGYAGSVPFHGWGMDELRGELAEGRSVVVSLGANGDHEPGHMVTVTGVSADGGWVYYNDPTLGKQVVSRAEFERMWGSQGNSGVAVRREAPDEGEAGAAPWVALAAGLMAAVSGAGLGGLREGVGGALMGSSGASGGKKKRAKNYNDDGGTMSLKKAHKRARRKRKARKKRRKRKKRRNRRNRRGRGGVKVDAKVVPEINQDGPSEDDGDSRGMTWFENKVIEIGQENENLRDVMTNTLAPTSDWLKSIADAEENPYLAHLHQNIPSEASAIMGAAATTPGIQDDLPIGVGIGLTFLAYHTITYFGKKNRRPPRFKVAERQKNMPQKSTLQQHPPEHEPREPRDDDKTVTGLTDVIGKIMESEKVSLGAKILTGILSTIYVAQVALGEKSKKDNESSIEFAQTQLASHLTPIQSTSTIHARLPTENMTPAPTQTSTINIEPSSEATAQPTPTPTKTPRPSEERDEKRYPPGMTKE